MRLFSTAFPLVFLLHAATVHANPISESASGGGAHVKCGLPHGDSVDCVLGGDSVPPPAANLPNRALPDGPIDKLPLPLPKRAFPDGPVDKLPLPLPKRALPDGPVDKLPLPLPKRALPDSPVDKLPLPLPKRALPDSPVDKLPLPLPKRALHGGSADPRRILPYLNGPDHATGQEERDYDLTVKVNPDNMKTSS